MLIIVFLVILPVISLNIYLYLQTDELFIIVRSSYFQISNFISFTFEKTHLNESNIRP